METPRKIEVSFEIIAKALLDNSLPFPPTYLHHFSDLTPEDLIQLEKIWNDIHPDRRFALMEDLEDLAVADTLMSFDELSKFALNDTDPRVRQTALQILWESNEPRLIPKFIYMLEKDEDLHVRAAAASSLGQFVYLGELEEISKHWLDQVETSLINVFKSNEDGLVRRRVLESLGFSSRKEVVGFIRQAYNDEDPEWLSSALFAMGRSADPVWVPAILDMLDHPNSDVQLQAVRALGELEYPQGRAPLLELLENGIDDDDVRMAAVWSLSKIGGEKVRETLEQMLEESEDDDESDLIEEAIDNLYFTEGFDQFKMFDFEPKDQDGLDATTDLDQEDSDEDIEDQ